MICRVVGFQLSFFFLSPVQYTREQCNAYFEPVGWFVKMFYSHNSIKIDLKNKITFFFISYFNTFSHHPIATYNLHFSNDYYSFGINIYIFQMICLWTLFTFVSNILLGKGKHIWTYFNIIWYVRAHKEAYRNCCILKLHSFNSTNSICRTQL